MIELLQDKWVLVGIFIAIFLVYTTFLSIKDHVIINRLGGRAPRIRGYLPLGQVLRWRKNKNKRHHN